MTRTPAADPRGPPPPPHGLGPLARTPRATAAAPLALGATPTSATWTACTLSRTRRHLAGSSPCGLSMPSATARPWTRSSSRPRGPPTPRPSSAPCWPRSWGLCWGSHMPGRARGCQPASCSVNSPFESTTRPAARSCRRPARYPPFWPPWTGTCWLAQALARPQRLRTLPLGTPTPVDSREREGGEAKEGPTEGLPWATTPPCSRPSRRPPLRPSIACLRDQPPRPRP
mmetsp:Transcript_21020/g.58290  ORF Transcript_21020/g.58290 Transcript_21020/m.58290 type:complete len:229 (+) Transcript_21020:2113-2799(+)